MKRALLLLALVACGGDDPPRLVLRETYAVAGDPAPVAAIMQRRLELLHVRGSVTVSGDEIVVDLPALSEARLASTDAVLARSGALAFHLVDDGSEVMRAAYQRVRTDPATPPSLRAEHDSWQDERTGARHEDFYLQASAPGEIINALYGQVPSDRKLGFEELGPDRWRSYWLFAEAALAEAHVVAARAKADRFVRVEVTFDAAGRGELADLTGTNVGRKVAIVLDGRVESAPVINARIEGGHLWITFGVGTDPRDADELAIVLTTGAFPSPVLLQDSEPLR